MINDSNTITYRNNTTNNIPTWYFNRSFIEKRNNCYYLNLWKVLDFELEFDDLINAINEAQRIDNLTTL